MIGDTWLGMGSGRAFQAMLGSVETVAELDQERLGGLSWTAPSW